jgi:hypothetical protein
MRTRVLSAAVFVALVTALPADVRAQAADPPNPPMDVSTLKNFLPIGPPAPLPVSKVPDLSGDWTFGAGGFGQSLSAADPGGRMRGKEPDIPYQPWALEYTMKQFPPTGPDAAFERTSDPNIHTCEPLGLGRIYMAPAKLRFIQTAEAVYILHEIGPTWRVVWLNAKHPDDPDPQYWGHSVGWYENGDTLVVDTIGTNDRSWLDQLGHPHTEKLHFIERFKKQDDKTIRLDMTVDDPGAYTRPWPGVRNFTKSATGFLRFQWVCSVRDNYEHYEKVGRTATPGETSFKK